MLVDLAAQDGFKVLLKVVDYLASEQERQVVSQTIQVGKETEVLYAKARAEGARRLQQALTKAVEKFKAK